MTNLLHKLINIKYLISLFDFNFVDHNPPSPHSKLLFFTISGSIALMILTWTLYAYLFPYSRPGRFLMRVSIPYNIKCY